MKIDLPININEQEVEVMVIVEQKKSRNSKTFADFAGKMNSNIDWIGYQKEIRNEW